jgi:hypothetical protein
MLPLKALKLNVLCRVGARRHLGRHARRVARFSFYVEKHQRLDAYIHVSD